MWFNPIMSWMIRSPLHFMISKSMMLMTYAGRKSGKSYTTPMNYLVVNGAFYTTSYRDRVWWCNLRGGADVRLHLRGEEVPARSETIEDQSNVAVYMRQYLETAPHLDTHWSQRLGGMAIQHDNKGNTLLTGMIPDQAALHGILVQIRDLGLMLISLKPSGIDE